MLSNFYNVHKTRMLLYRIRAVAMDTDWMLGAWRHKETMLNTRKRHNFCQYHLSLSLSFKHCSVCVCLSYHFLFLCFPVFIFQFSSSTATTNLKHPVTHKEMAEGTAWKVWRRNKNCHIKKIKKNWTGFSHDADLLVSYINDHYKCVYHHLSLSPFSPGLNFITILRYLCSVHKFFSFSKKWIPYVLDHHVLYLCSVLQNIWLWAIRPSRSVPL